MPVKPSRHHGATRRPSSKPSVMQWLRQPQALDRLLDALVVVSVSCALIVGAIALLVTLLV
ncbi:hypothetical protein GCM10027040_18910 [Halomonas shantousis]